MSWTTFMTERIKAEARRQILEDAAVWFANEDIAEFGPTPETARDFVAAVLVDEALRPGGPKFAP